MNLTIKARPEDFKVDEIADLPLLANGPFAVYCLEKKGWNTVDALREISKDLRISSHAFSYGGKKDRHAQTSQMIAIEDSKVKDYTKENLSLAFIGFMDRPMGPDLIKGNRFEIAVRRMSFESAQRLMGEAAHIKTRGFVNYFDDQRFGSFDSGQGFLAEKLLLGHFMGAVKIFMTSVYSGDPVSEKKRKSFFLKYWKDWKTCASQAHNVLEKFAFAELQKGEKGALAVLNRIPREDLSMYFSAFQSFLWNEVASVFLREVIEKDLISLQGAAGEYLFYRDVPKDTFHDLVSVVIPTAAHNTKMSDERLARIYADLLASRSIQKPMFNKLKIRRAFFKTTDRSLIVVPKDSTSEIFDDEIYPGQKKVVLKFTLPRGSYATMLIKRLQI